MCRLLIAFVLVLMSSFVGRGQEGPYYENFEGSGERISLPRESPTPKRRKNRRLLLNVDKMGRAEHTFVLTEYQERFPPSLAHLRNDYDICCYMRLQLDEDVDSYVLYMHPVQEDVEPRLYLINIKDGHYVSCALLSLDYYVNDDNNGHVYSVIKDNRITIYERIINVCDVTSGEPVRIPIHIKLRITILRFIHSILERFHPRGSYNTIELTMAPDGHLSCT